MVFPKSTFSATCSRRPMPSKFPPCRWAGALTLLQSILRTECMRGLVESAEEASRLPSATHSDRFGSADFAQKSGRAPPHSRPLARTLAHRGRRESRTRSLRRSILLRGDRLSCQICPPAHRSESPAVDRVAIAGFALFLPGCARRADSPTDTIGGEPSYDSSLVGIDCEGGWR